MSIDGADQYDVISQRYRKGLHTYIITLKFPDLSVVHQDDLERIGYGGDVWEFRADLLECPLLGKTAVQPIQFIRNQLQILQRSTQLPILFTVRTVSQGGRFPDDAAHEALALMKLAVELGCAYIDVEINWPAFVIDEIRALVTSSRIVASYHELSTNVRWTSAVLQEKLVALDAVGDVLKLCVQSVDINDNLEHGLFLRDYQRCMEKPIIAVAMGLHGRLSRFLAPIAFVAHRLIPQPPESEQLTLSQINQALWLLGQLPTRKFVLAGIDPFHSSIPFLAAFEDLGLPYSIYEANHNWQTVAARPDFGGACSSGWELQVGQNMPELELSPAARTIGLVDTISVTDTSGERLLCGDNTTWTAIKACIGKCKMACASKTTVLVVGVGQRSRAACYAAQRLGVRNIIVISADEDKAQAMAVDFHGRSSRPTELKDVMESLAMDEGLIVFKCGGHDLQDEELSEHVPSQLDPVCIELELELELGQTPHSRDWASTARYPAHWKVYTLSDVLREQSYLQFESWTQRQAPRLVMKSAMKAQARLSPKKGRPELQEYPRALI
ncbi:hypothetical protein A1O3_03257 [Capronia epimyces CBS 606.96]|uniref:3-dehydroquinate dehydratase I n=1 Tax=Capronia epimyces CBS 606.96 TaxID=1182542 RepID=W9YAL0_9EURO|nr:uncharacterized protein A1O3_03257 [Capronia epimyces CBS 606.96]EXJ86306.1 hypothetical protein A1O3_03257 [Capronia epimyces CBS 606.96]